MNNKLTYTEAKEELKAILQLIDSPEVKIDELQELLTRAKELVTICEELLRKIDNVQDS